MVNKKNRRRAKGRLDFRRHDASRNERDKVLIVTEGEKTEPAYFKLLIAELDLTTAKVRIAGEGGSAPISVVQTAEHILGKDADFEQIYLVFDRDRHPTYDEAIAKVSGLKDRMGAEGKTIKCITSVPCFEVWYAFHVSNSCKPYAVVGSGASPAKSLITDLRKTKLNDDALFENYSKSNCDEFFSKIAPKRGTAVKNAKRSLEQAKERGEGAYQENPSTRVHLVVEALEKLAKSQI